MRFDRPWAVIELDRDGSEYVLSWWPSHDDAVDEARWQSVRYPRPLGTPRYIVRNMARSLPHGLRAEGAPQ